MFYFYAKIIGYILTIVLAMICLFFYGKIFINRKKVTIDVLEKWLHTSVINLALTGSALAMVFFVEQFETYGYFFDFINFIMLIKTTLILSPLTITAVLIKSWLQKLEAHQKDNS